MSKHLGKAAGWAAVYVVVLVAFATFIGARVESDPTPTIELPSDSIPLDPRADLRPDSAAFLEVGWEGSGVHCLWSYRDGVRYRWPASALGFGLSTAPLEDVVHLDGAQLCVRLVPTSEPIT